MQTEARLKRVGVLKTRISPDLVSSLHSDPLRNRPVLFLLLSEEALNPESLVGRLEKTKPTSSPSTNF